MDGCNSLDHIIKKLDVIYVERLSAARKVVATETAVMVVVVLLLLLLLLEKEKR